MSHKVRDLKRFGGSPVVEAAGRPFPVEVTRHRWARRYILRVTDRGTLRLTVPRALSIRDGLSFAERQTDWIAREWRRLELQSRPWGPETQVWFRGERITLRVEPGRVTWADEVARVREGESVRTAVERHLRRLATHELGPRSRVLAGAHHINLGSVSVRNQRSRWGSCSRRRTVTLNWRLVQMPPEVADYIILHELAHIGHPNHSARFWQAVGKICPSWRESERWLRKHGRELL